MGPSRGRRRAGHRWRAVAIVLLAGCVAAACRSGGSEERAQSGPPADADAVVVASFNFPESRLLAEIYALALAERGVPVVRELDLGPRELVEPALRQGLVDVVPEYLGTALQQLDPNAAIESTDVAAAHAALAAAFGRIGLVVLEPAAAQDQNGFAVTRGTAERLALRRVSDLVGHDGSFTLTGPPECPHRRHCLPGLAEVYGVHPDRFLPYDTVAQRLAALDQGIADVAVLFTTDGHTATGEYALLEDDRGLQPVENVVPVVSARADARWGTVIRPALDEVSARLTASSLTFLNWRIVLAGRDPAGEARGWLLRQGLLPRG